VRVVIADDNHTELRYIKQLLSQEKDVEIISEVYNGPDAWKAISKYNPDVAFLDITMPGMSGMALAKRIRETVFTVFITAHSEFALDAFEIGSVDYLLKPVSPERLELTLKRIRKRLATKQSLKISVNIKGEIVSIVVDQIVFIETVPFYKKVSICTTKGKYTVSSKLASFEEKLKHWGFARCHKSFIVNVNRVKRLIPSGDKTYIAVMHGSDREVLVSRKYAPVIKSMLIL